MSVYSTAKLSNKQLTASLSRPIRMFNKRESEVSLNTPSWGVKSNYQNMKSQGPEIRFKPKNEYLLRLLADRNDDKGAVKKIYNDFRENMNVTPTMNKPH